MIAPLKSLGLLAAAWMLPWQQPVYQAPTSQATGPAGQWHFDLKAAPSRWTTRSGGSFPTRGPSPGASPSLEYDYLSLRALMTGPETFDWQPMEALLDAIAGRGHQAVVRVYVEYPGRNDGLPQFLIDRGVKITQYKEDAEFAEENFTPDYRSKYLRRALVAFVEAFGKRYDGDARLGFVEAGLLGHWGEWHTYPREDLWADKGLQRNVLDAYEKSSPIRPCCCVIPPARTIPSTIAPTIASSGTTTTVSPGRPCVRAKRTTRGSSAS
ncbi:MAG: hypothetical protein R3E96_14860 [Planctomycetota bacterium]